VVLGGSKVSDKLAVIENLAGKADSVVLGSGLRHAALVVGHIRVLLRGCQELAGKVTHCVRLSICASSACRVANSVLAVSYFLVPGLLSVMSLFALAMRACTDRSRF
jgi:hypothetical protein